MLDVILYSLGMAVLSALLCMLVMFLIDRIAHWVCD